MEQAILDAARHDPCRVRLGHFRGDCRRGRAARGATRHGRQYARPASRGEARCGSHGRRRPRALRASTSRPEIVEEARRAVTDAGADAVLAYGGGSAIGLAKAIALDVDVRVIAIPDDLLRLGDDADLRHYRDGEKQTGRDERARPALVVYDPDLTAALPRDVTVTSLWNAMAHAVEALWDERRGPRHPALRRGSAAAARAQRDAPVCVGRRSRRAGGRARGRVPRGRGVRRRGFGDSPQAVPPARRPVRAAARGDAQRAAPPRRAPPARSGARGDGRHRAGPRRDRSGARHGATGARHRRAAVAREARHASRRHRAGRGRGARAAGVRRRRSREADRDVRARLVRSRTGGGSAAAARACRAPAPGRARFDARVGGASRRAPAPAEHAAPYAVWHAHRVRERHAVHGQERGELARLDVPRPRVVLPRGARGAAAVALRRGARRGGSEPPPLAAAADPGSSRRISSMAW